MANAREVKLRIRSVKNIAQVTRALQAVSASKVQKAMQAMYRTRPYATKAWQVLTHVAAQPGRGVLHPLLAEREQVKNTLIVLISGDRGLAGAYNANIVRFTLQKFGSYPHPAKFITIGRKGRDLMFRRGQEILAEFSNLPAAPEFADVSAIGHLAVDEFLSGNVDEVYLVYTDFVNMVKQIPTVKKLLPLEVDSGEGRVEAFGIEQHGPEATYIYEPGQEQLLDEIVPRFTALQVYQAVMESLASEHAARMVAMKNATENATELSAALQLQYNKARQQSITSEMLDIAGGAEALAQS
ncbi:MAG: ATP synthase F1 subunit gamma [Chloroflexi bacterium]|mgnify:CR=1 FL=1|jgi:F-type H+-transporting ATPase subunit gamma|nr:ATP synthase F1 subunit gamma [Chloroflexota bacterium]MBT7080650.1 ATP synthase F1 subunit gamma [Chloroflexota bacterium]